VTWARNRATSRARICASSTRCGNGKYTPRRPSKRRTASSRSGFDRVNSSALSGVSGSMRTARSVGWSSSTNAVSARRSGSVTAGPCRGDSRPGRGRRHERRPARPRPRRVRATGCRATCRRRARMPVQAEELDSLDLLADAVLLHLEVADGEIVRRPVVAPVTETSRGRAGRRRGTPAVAAGAVGRGTAAGPRARRTTPPRGKRRPREGARGHRSLVFECAAAASARAAVDRGPPARRPDAEPDAEPS